MPKGPVKFAGSEHLYNFGRLIMNPYPINYAEF